MTPEQRQRVGELFERALDQPPGAERRAWVAREACDEVVRVEVESLLAHDDAAGAFLSEPVLERHQELMADGARFTAGDMLGSYRIERELGRGGMGEVYLASDPSLGRPVALKVLAPGLVSDQEQRDRLWREARAAAKINHPGVCTVYSFGPVGDELVIASEYVEGHSLRTEIEAGLRPSSAELIGITQALVSAVAAAHAAGVVHRDLKPENVMRTSNGSVKVLDFGLALVVDRAAEQLPRTTMPGTVIGTPAYMAPEQIRHERVDGRADIFALGVLLFEFASGVHPFAAPTAVGMWARTLEGSPTPLRGLRGDLPLPLCNAIERCLQRRPDDRFQVVTDILAALETPATPRAETSGGFWWRTHMVAVFAMYVVAALGAWSLHEFMGVVGRPGFAAVAMLATIGGIFRGHLLFAERQLDTPAFLAELRRSRTPLHAVDGLLTLLLVSAGLWMSSTAPVRGALIGALGLGFALARLVLERSTTLAAFAALQED